jgi:hypothetical protein
MPLPSTARVDAQLCSATRRAPRHGPAPRCLTIRAPVNDPLNMRLFLGSRVLFVPTFVVG